MFSLRRLRKVKGKDKYLLGTHISYTPQTFGRTNSVARVKYTRLTIISHLHLNNAAAYSISYKSIVTIFVRGYPDKGLGPYLSRTSRQVNTTTVRWIADFLWYRTSFLATASSLGRRNQFSESASVNSISTVPSCFIIIPTCCNDFSGTYSFLTAATTFWTSESGFLSTEPLLIGLIALSDYSIGFKNL